MSSPLDRNPLGVALVAVLTVTMYVPAGMAAGSASSHDSHSSPTPLGLKEGSSSPSSPAEETPANPGK